MVYPILFVLTRKVELTRFRGTLKDHLNPLRPGTLYVLTSERPAALLGSSGIHQEKMTRDQGLFPDDRVAIALDPSNTRRDGYFFEVNPNGARREGLIENNSNLRTEWNTIWAAKAQIVDDGWVAT